MDKVEYRMPSRQAVAGLLFAVLLPWTGAADEQFARYQVILDRKPFGAAPPPEAAPPPPPLPPGEGFAKMIKLSAMIEPDDGSPPKVGIIDMKNNQNYFLQVGEISPTGIELVSMDYEAEEAVLRQGTEMAIIKLQSGDIQALTPEQQQARLAQPPAGGVDPSRMSYIDRRRMREEQRKLAAQPPPAPPPPPQPKLTGEDLQKHLQEYQMEVIRQGLPPLPIPLTPEMDAQLVNEGVLPPQE